MCVVIMSSCVTYDSSTKHNAHLTLFTPFVIWPGMFWNPLYITVFMQRVLHGGRRFWIIQLNYIKEELVRTDMKEVTEAYSAHMDTHTVYKRNTVYERSTRITTDILLLGIATTATTTATTTTVTSGYCDFIPV